jgi:hypothetical protein
MSKIALTGLALLSLLFFANVSANNASQPKQYVSEAPTGTLQRMIVENGSANMNVDLNGLNGSNDLVTRPITIPFAVGTNSFFPILVFNDELRGPEPGSIALVVQGRSVPLLPPALASSLKHLVLEKFPYNASSDLAIRDARTGFTFFEIDGPQYDYDPNAQLFSITEGRLLISNEFANALGRPSDAGALVGKISVGAVMQPIEITQINVGEPKSMVMPPLHDAADGEAPTLVPGPDVIVGVLSGLAQFENAGGTRVGLAVGTDSCNNGDEPLNWFSLGAGSNDHPVIPQNLYRMSGGTTNNERFEQVGQSSVKHAFTALELDACGFGCNTAGCQTGTHLCPGCSDPYSASLNAGPNLGSRAWINPFTGSFPVNPNPNNHSGHVHDGTSHRILVEINDLNTSLNPGATYFTEAQYVTPHEYRWCQDHFLQLVPLCGCSLPSWLGPAQALR